MFNKALPSEAIEALKVLFDLDDDDVQGRDNAMGSDENGSDTDGN